MYTSAYTRPTGTTLVRRPTQTWSSAAPGASASLDVVLFEEEDESPLVGPLQVEAV
jgi:hypothetical protein